MVIPRLKDVFTYQGKVLKVKTLIKDSMVFKGYRPVEKYFFFKYWDGEKYFAVSKVLGQNIPEFVCRCPKDKKYKR